MAKSKNPIINGVVFSSQGDAIDYYRKIRDRYSRKQRLSPCDFNELMALLLLHEQYESKIEPGISHIIVDIDIQGRNNCFWLVYQDGSRDDFSWPHCVKRAPLAL